MLSFSPPKENLNGDYPSIAIHPTKNIAVCAYESTITTAKYYRVGAVKHSTIEWGEEIMDGHGECLRVAFFDRNGTVYIIAVYRCILWRECYYQINTCQPDSLSMKLGEPKLLCSGIRPTFAARDDGTVVVVTEQPYSYTLECHIGRISNDVSEIAWSRLPELFDQGTCPSVAINNTHIILLYRIRASNALKYASGNLTDKVEWKVSGQDYATGIRPNVALNNNQVVVTTHVIIGMFSILLPWCTE